MLVSLSKSWGITSMRGCWRGCFGSWLHWIRFCHYRSARYMKANRFSWSWQDWWNKNRQYKFIQRECSPIGLQTIACVESWSSASHFSCKFSLRRRSKSPLNLLCGSHMSNFLKINFVCSAHIMKWDMFPRGLVTI